MVELGTDFGKRSYIAERRYRYVLQLHQILISSFNHLCER
jgi:hypothetical protein